MNINKIASTAVAFSIVVSGPLLEARAEDKPSGAQHPVAADAKKRGVRCVERVQELAARLTQNAQYGAHIVVAPKDVKDHLYTSVMTRRNPDGGTQLISMSVAPDKACSATFDVSTVWSGPCDRIAAQFFAKHQPKSVLPGGVQIREASPYEQLYLVPLPGGCLSVQKETRY